MQNYQNKKDLRRIGKKVQALRADTEFNVEDIAYMTGFTRKTIVAIENGSNTDISHIIEVAKAIGVQPKDVFDIEFDIKPRFKLSPQRLNSNLLTKRLTKLVNETNFFNSPQPVSAVIDQLLEEYHITTESTKVSVVLKRLANEGKLTFQKSGRNNIYSRKKGNTQPNTNERKSNPLSHRK